MGKDFIKFMVLVLILYLGFLTTFSLVGHDRYSVPSMTMILTKIFFGSGYVGLDVMNDIDPIFGPPLMIIFVMLSSILLMGSLTGMLSNSFSRVITHAREEYLYVYSVYVLEASTSNRLTHFYPPFNLLALIIFRPLRLFIPSGDRLRGARILLLKATHLPIVGLIELYELLMTRFGKGRQGERFKGPRHGTISSPGLVKKRDQQQHTPNIRPDSSYFNGISPRPPSASEVPRLAPPPRKNAASDAAEDNCESNDVNARIADLATKIDQLTQLVLQVQQAQTVSHLAPRHTAPLEASL
jgi:hypothetical protein